MSYWYSYNCIARVRLREVKTIPAKVHLGQEARSKKMMSSRTRKKVLAPTRLERPRKTKYWRTSKSNWILSNIKIPCKR